jgi:hypothetical protein
MDKFLGPPSRLVVKESKYADNDSRSISEKINNSIFLKGGLPTLQQKQPHQAMGNSFDDLINNIDGMEHRFDQPNEISDEIDEKDFEMFKMNVKSWIEYDNYIIEIDKKKREWLKKRNEYNELIIRFMKKYEVNDINIDEVEKLKFDVKNRACGYTKKSLQENVYQYFTQNKETADQLLKHLETSRLIKASENLKRVRNK